MTYKIALVTDSTNDLPAEFREKYEIYVVPLTIIWGGKQYLDGVELQKFQRHLSLPPRNLLANIKKRSKMVLKKLWSLPSAVP